VQGYRDMPCEKHLPTCLFDAWNSDKTRSDAIAILLSFFDVMINGRPCEPWAMNGMCQTIDECMIRCMFLLIWTMQEYSKSFEGFDVFNRCRHEKKHFRKREILSKLFFQTCKECAMCNFCKLCVSLHLVVLIERRQFSAWLAPHEFNQFLLVDALSVVFFLATFRSSFFVKILSMFSQPFERCVVFDSNWSNNAWMPKSNSV